MGKNAYRLIVLFVILALFLGTLPSGNIEAAKKKSKTSITVSTQEELVKALKSGKYKKITIKTDAKVSFTLAAKYSNSDLKIVVDAKNATFNSKGTVGSIVINEAKTVKEYSSGNKITVNDEKLTFKAMEGASVETLKIASETGEVKLVNNGEIGRVDVTGESKVAVEQNGSVGRLYVAAAAEIGVAGTSEEKLAVTVKPEAAGAAVKSELPVKVNAYADIELQLEKGAENSAVTLKNEDAGVKLENNTDKKVTVTDSEGEKQTVKKGEDLTSDNYVGKKDETEDDEDSAVSEQSGEEVKEEEEKKEEEGKKEEGKEDDKEEIISGNNNDGDTNNNNNEGDINNDDNQGDTNTNPPSYAEWGQTEYEWSADYKTLTATMHCLNGVEQDRIETVGVDEATTEATCTDKGKIVYTSKAFETYPGIFEQQTKTVETPILGHKWGEPTYTWSENNGTVTAKRVCANDTKHIETETVTVVSQVTKQPTTTQKGETTYTTADFSNTAFEKQTKTLADIDMIPSAEWGQAEYEWSADYKTLTATMHCLNGVEQDRIETVGVDEATTEATCTTKGKTVYTSKAFETYPGIFEQQTKTVETPVLGHKWGGVTYTWSEDNKSVTAERVCANDAKHIETETVTVVSEVTKQPTTTQKGETTYTSADFSNKAFEKQTKTLADIDMIPSAEWGQAEYEWSTDNKTLTATMHCLNGVEQDRIETVGVDEATTEATCTTKGKTVYTSKAFEIYPDVFEQQTKTIETQPALGHEWGEVTYTWSKDKKYVTAECKCIRVASHTETETAEVVSKTIKPSTCEDPGEKSYSASFKNSIFASWSEVEATPALDHDYRLTENVVPKPIFDETGEEGVYGDCIGWERGKKIYVCSNDSKHTYTEEVKVPLAVITDDESGICVINGSDITFNLEKKLEQYNSQNSQAESLEEAFGKVTVEEYICSLEVNPYNDELKQWWIIPEGVVEQELMNLMLLQSSLDNFIGDGIGGFVFEDNSDEINIHDGQYSGQTISFEVEYVPMDEDTFETLNIIVTFILP